MKIDFDSLAGKLATTDGGYALWVGAGASIALTNGATPGWSALVSSICKSHAVGTLQARPDDMPAQLEEVSESIGHVRLRRELRLKLLDPIDAQKLDADVLVAQAIIGARASVVVSFNIEPITALPFIGARSGRTLTIRTFRERNQLGVESSFTTQPGIVSVPVYFPHGLLLEANVVMTKSEYDKHMGSIAVTTAVHLALGGDLVILGMSLGDPYLRDAILQNRRWLRSVYWLGTEPTHEEWARVAQVTFVEVKHSRMWGTLASSFIAADTRGELQKHADHLRKSGTIGVGAAIAAYRGLPNVLKQHAQRLVGISEMSEEKITEFAQFCLDTGSDVPPVLLHDPRCRL